ncbi:aldo/keto reductase [Furfurilactobacillus milii]|uniref:Aldo/keto reductase n=1 Tax=Furfurilactobacillus milii TaxID=2888272 RepID=A0A6N9I3Z8_9LACO|nr:aldo/keto reductase [Furfurilactobacillus milii]MYV17852.1 aldo/keto reductase [Furfurilactobacillus milii]
MGQIKFELPKVGFGTYQLTGETGMNTIKQAINTGYRLIDTAISYENEGAVGAAIKASDVDRDQLIVSSKLPGRDYHHDDAISAVQESLYRSGLDYFDLFLLHWPNPKQNLYVEAWTSLIEAQRRGYVKYIGVSNFTGEYIDRLQNETGIQPVVNQIELHPYFNQEAQRRYDYVNGIITEAWSPLGRASAMLKDPVLQQIANKHQCGVGQVILRWEQSLNVVPLPKAAHVDRQRASLNLDAIDLDQADITAINQLTKPDGRTFNQDPTVYEEF